MFKTPFSFRGRIRRTEYALSYIILLASFSIIGVLIEANDAFEILALPLVVAGYWFVMAQGAKRCHDMNTSGWFQLIPFYGFIMLFSSGSSGLNRFGPNPKYPYQPNPEIAATVVEDTNTKEFFKNISGLHVANEVIASAILSTFIILSITLQTSIPIISYLAYLVGVVVGFFLFLKFTSVAEHFKTHKTPMLWLRWLYALVLAVAMFIFDYVYLDGYWEAATVIEFISYTVVFFVLTYIPRLIYNRYMPKTKAYA